MTSGKNRWLVAGTDTGVGKTHVTAALATMLRRQGVEVRAIKPVETGCEFEPSPHEDGVVLAAAAGQSAPARALLRFGAPVAPCVAADAEGRPFTFAALLAATEAALAPAPTWSLIEGAGGLLSPLAWDGTALDLAAALRARVLLVAANRLGTLSHVRLALHALRTLGVDCVGVVLSAPAAPDASTGANAAALSRIEPGLRLIEVPRAPIATVAAHLGPCLGW